MIKLLHAADLHLDSPFSSLPPEQAARRRQAQRDCLQTLPRLCQQEQCDAVLLAGDLFDTPQVYPETLEAVFAALEACQVPVFIAPGNHDPIQPDSPYQKHGWPSNVHIFQTTKPTTVERKGFTVSGAAFCGTAKPSLAGFTAPRDDRVHIMVLHGEVSGQKSDYQTGTPMQVAASRLQYLALGHIHQRGARKTSTGTTYAWPGCMMGRGFDETGAKGVYLVQIDETGVQLQFRHLDVPRYEILQLPAQQLWEQLPVDTQKHHYRLQLTGIGPKPDLRLLHSQLAERFAALELEDLTQRPVRMPEEDTLAGLFVKNIEQMAMQTEYDQQTLELAQSLGLRLLQGREVTLP